jgi:acyl-CoA reductase-like NAD-dependent aldehyde dehydrogenase
MSQWVAKMALQVLALAERAVATALFRAGEALLSAGSLVREARAVDTCSANAGALYVGVTQRFDSLSEEAQAAFAALCMFLCLVAFVVAMPVLMSAILGSTPILTPVPLPQEDEVTDDPYSSIYAESETRPLLADSDAVDAGTYRGPVVEAGCPSTGMRLGFVPADTANTVVDKIAAARKAQVAWAATSFADRRVVLNVLKVYVLEEQHDLCALSMIDTGKTMLDASLGEILTTLEKLRWVAAEGEKFLSPDVRSTGPATMHKLATVEYFPVGVIAAIAPWNYPLHNFFNPVISSLFAGNAIVVKPSEHTAYSSVYFARIIRRALTLCGHSPELVQVLVGGADVGAALVDGDIDKLFFTGSTAVGHAVASAASKRLLPVVLELGGKDPFIICDDYASIDHATDICMRGVFQNAGQNCIGVERVFVHASVKQRVVDRAVSAAKAIRLAVDMGAITMCAPALAKIQELVDDAVKSGAVVLAGGKIGKVVDGTHDDGFFFEPTVLDLVRPDMRIAQEEVFGPVMSIIEWDGGDEELVAMVNDSVFGLGSSIFCGNPRRANRIMAGVKAGMGNINDYATNYMCQSMPFGGMKKSGSDRFAGVEGLRGCCVVKAMTRDRFAGVSTVLPAAFKYPTRENAFSLASEINDLMYRDSMLCRLDNLRNVCCMLMSKTWKPRSTGNR